MPHSQGIATDEDATAMGRRARRRSAEIAAALSLALLLVILALTLEPVRSGDGQYYLAMLEGLANDASPAFTDRVRSAVVARVNSDIGGLTATARDGRIYGAHFFAYPLLSVPAYRFLAAVGLDTFKAFQLTNALLISLALFWVLAVARLPVTTRWFIAAGFLLSTGTIYFQWSHPEVFSAAFVLTSCVAFLDKRYTLAALFAAIGSLQNPSVVLLILPVVTVQGWECWARGGRRLLSPQSLRALGATLAVSLVALSPYIWNYAQFGLLNPIIGLGYFDYSNISVRKLLSFILDLNQGLIVGLPLLIFAIPAVIALRLVGTVTRQAPFLRREDFLLIGFLLMAIPTLGQVNWNAGHSVFSRYAAWAGMAPLVWAGVSFGRVGSAWSGAIVTPVIALQLLMALYVGGISINRFPSYVGFMPWVQGTWLALPHFYHPLPEIFFERLVGREEAIQTPAILKGWGGQMLRVLTRQKTVSQTAEEVCGAGGTFVPTDGRASSLPVMHKTERGYRYVTGRFICRD